MKKLLLRTLTGFLYVALIVCTLLWGGVIGFTLLCCLFAMLGMLEFLRLSKGSLSGHVATAVIDILTGLGFVSLLAVSDGLWEMAEVWLMVIGLLFAVRVVMQLYLHTTDPIKDISLSGMAVCYVALPLTAAVWFYYLFGPQILLLVFIMIWLNDTGAFLVGSMIGRHRLFERLSPKKSWEGFWGGLLFCVLAGWLANMIFPGYFGGSPVLYIILGIIVSVFSTWGDLFESMLKRTVGVKDSGNILPGHGGMLDRIDSLLFVVPAVSGYFFFITNILNSIF